MHIHSQAGLVGGIIRIMWTKQKRRQLPADRAKRASASEAAAAARSSITDGWPSLSLTASKL